MTSRFAGHFLLVLLLLFYLVHKYTKLRFPLHKLPSSFPQGKEEERKKGCQTPYRNQRDGDDSLEAFSSLLYFQAKLAHIFCYHYLTCLNTHFTQLLNSNSTFWEWNSARFSCSKIRHSCKQEKKDIWKAKKKHFKIRIICWVGYESARRRINKTKNPDDVRRNRLWAWRTACLLNLLGSWREKRMSSQYYCD